MNFNKKLRCKVCGTSVPVLSKMKQDSLKKGFSVTVYCTNSNCENHLGGLIGPSNFKKEKL